MDDRDEWQEGERAPGKSVLAGRHDDDDDGVYSAYNNAIL